MQRVTKKAEQDQHEANRQRDGHADHDGRTPPHRDEQDEDDDEGGKQQALRKTIKAVIGVETLVEDCLDLESWRRGCRKIFRYLTRTFSPFIDALAGRNIDADHDRAEIVLIGLLSGRIGKALLNPGHIGHANSRSVGTLQERNLANTGYAIEFTPDLKADRAAFTAQAARWCLAVSRGDQCRARCL